MTFTNNIIRITQKHANDTFSLEIQYINKPAPAFKKVKQEQGTFDVTAIHCNKFQLNRPNIGTLTSHLTIDFVMLRSYFHLFC